MGRRLPINASLSAVKVAPAVWHVLYTNAQVHDEKVGVLRLQGGNWWFVPIGGTRPVKFNDFNQGVRWLRFGGELRDSP